MGSKSGQDTVALMSKMDRLVMTPFRGVLIQGKAAGELTLIDVEVAADAIMGALHMVSMKTLITEGAIDVEELAGAVVPQLVNGLLSR